MVSYMTLTFPISSEEDVLSIHVAALSKVKTSLSTTSTQLLPKLDDNLLLIDPGLIISEAHLLFAVQSFAGKWKAHYQSINNNEEGGSEGGGDGGGGSGGDGGDKNDGSNRKAKKQRIEGTSAGEDANEVESSGGEELAASKSSSSSSSRRAPKAFDNVGTLCFALSGTANKPKSITDYNVSSWPRDLSSGGEEGVDRLLFSINAPFPPSILEASVVSSNLTFNSAASVKQYFEDRVNTSKLDRLQHAFKLSAYERLEDQGEGGMEGAVLTRMSTKEYVKI
jgi:hypothetical protein